ncbi:flavin reductase family protein [Sediminibacterium sp. TEGAF015]|uniref:flavin reductase family protein n=1 Tax=Sediminibacterium sp. TEGAF015 TaxID=575378 RepID=UPI00220F4B98|nr:flavin reductase [Sediminibacterium sp. TEGAF015]BDQ12406.1 flavin oxidoreductase [Sediminibacterium sp. TEGAF015]
MRLYSLGEIQKWERFYRANFINCLSGFKPVSLVGTVSKEGVPNLSVISNIVHLGADPALIGYINRPLPAAPDSIQNIKDVQHYTVNHITEDIFQKAHQSSAKYEPAVNEFEAVGLASQFEEGIPAPFVQESPVKYHLQLVEIVPISHNQTFLVIGALQHVFLSESLVQTDGFIDLEKAGSMLSLGLDGYANATMVQRLPYAKP